MVEENAETNEELRHYWKEQYEEIWREIAGSDSVVGNVTYFLSQSQGRYRPPRSSPREVILFEWPVGRFHSWERESGRGPWDSIATEVLGNSITTDEAEAELHRRIENEVKRLRENRR